MVKNNVILYCNGRREFKFAYMWYKLSKLNTNISNIVPFNLDQPQSSKINFTVLNEIKMHYTVSNLS